jgi:hypothetical protein
MAQRYNIYCDESCHLEHDSSPYMVLGAVVCPEERAREVAERLREIKRRNGLSKRFELKWSRVLSHRKQYYHDVTDYFFDDDSLRFRAVIIPKHDLDHDRFQQDHDTFYHKMYFYLLRALLSPHARYSIYLDIKDTRSGGKIRKLHEVLCNSVYDFDRRIVEQIQTVRSHEVEQVQLADLLIGAVAYANRGDSASATKLGIVERLKKRTEYSLTRTTLLREEKFNLFRWDPQRVENGD